MIKLIQPTYVLKLPSSGKQIKYRPFVVREEKALLMAMQEENPKGIIENIKNLVRECTFGVVDPEKTSYYDLEYIFLMIRGKSVSEVVELIGNCDCGAKTEFSVNVEDAKVEGLKQKSKFKIEGTDYYVEMMHPNINYFVNDEKDEDESSSSDNDYYRSTASSIKAVYTEDEVFDSMSVQEKVDFLDNLTSKQQKPIADFIRSMPKLVVNGKYDCSKCGKQHNIDVSGVERFFI